MAALRKTLMSMPISAMITAPTNQSTPGMVFSKAIRRYTARAFGDPRVERGNIRFDRLDAAELHRKQEAVMLFDAAVRASINSARLRRSWPRASSAISSGVAPPATAPSAWPGRRRRIRRSSRSPA